MDELFKGALFAYDEEEDETAELRGIMAYSGSGKLCVLPASLLAAALPASGRPP